MGETIGLAENMDAHSDKRKLLPEWTAYVNRKIQILLNLLRVQSNKMNTRYMPQMAQGKMKHKYAKNNRLIAHLRG